MKLNPPNAHRSQIKICEKRQTRNVQFRFMPNTFRILKPIQKSLKLRFECFITQVQTHLPEPKRVWPMKINVICTVAPQIFKEARDKDVGPDRRNVSWSPENVLIDTVARLQRDLADMRAESQFLRTPGSHL